MQQQICQEQLGNQQTMSQQMVLCPVRLVYETQIFMQPGDQIHPNQTFFVNPHNPPPWAQSRPQNQVVYVQQLANNIVPNIQHHMDQNQFYVQQNIANYQISPPMLAPSQEQMRQLQMTNMIPSNMIQNYSNIQNERNVGQTFTYGHMANTSQSAVPNQANTTPNNRQMMINTVTATQTNQSAINPQTVAELQRQGAYMNVRPQMVQHHSNTTRPQVVTVNSLQNIQNYQQQQTIGQTYVQNVGQTLVQPQNPITNMYRAVQPTNTMTNLTKLREATPISNVNTNTFNASVSNTRNVPAYTYRTIQPRPQFRQILPNMPIQNVQAQLQHISPTVYNSNKDNCNETVPNTTSSYGVNTDNNKTFSRKRKSESPDELHAKISAGPAIKASDSANTKQVNMILKSLPKSIEIGVNTNPGHKIEHNISGQNNNAAQIVRFVDSGQQTVQLEKASVKPFNETTASNQIDKDKLIRNTVYTQARGRLLNDKQSILHNDNINVEDANTQDKPKDVQTEKSDIQLNRLEKITTENTDESPLQNNTCTLDSVNKQNDKKIEKHTENINTNGSKEGTLQPADKITFKQENNYILTHVLDGYVIQESNVAFPIRKPLKEKTPNMDNSEEQNLSKDETINEKVKDLPRDNSKIIDLPILPLYYLDLNNEHKEEGEKTECIDLKKDKPFASLEQATVKSWTIDQLAAHLTNHTWNETVSILQEHEIDGESLFLVSKAQLVKIGVSEEHADVICEFVKKD